MIDFLKLIFGSPLFAGVVNVLSLVGIFLAWRSWKDGKKLSANTTKLTASTDQLVDTASSVEKSLSTIYLGQWPAYISKVEEVVSEAAVSIKIMSIVPGFGSFSSPDEWEDLSNALIRKQKEGIPVKLITGTMEARKRNGRLQFKEAIEDWNGWQKSRSIASKPTNEVLLTSFCERYDISKRPQSGDEFLEALNAVQEKLLERTYHRVVPTFTEDSISLIAWIADDKRAIFAIGNAKGAPPAFHTHDKNIVLALSGLADRLAEDSN